MNAARITMGRAKGLKGICVLAVVAAMPAGLQGAERAPEAKVMRDVATHDSIVETGRIAREEAAKQELKQQQEHALKPVPPELRPKPPEKRSLLAVSDVICFNGLATMVPKRSVLHVPKNLTDRIGMQDGARFVDFQEFISKNRAWLTSSAVTRAQAEGNEPMSEGVVKSFAKETRIVVATYYEGPISVLPLKVPPTETAAVVPAGASANSNAAKK
jgi:hypothetical protein